VHHRFYAPELSEGQELVRLPPDEAEHLARVLRLRVGAVVQVFDGRGRECRGAVEQIERGGVTVRVTGQMSPVPETVVRLILAQAVLKGDAMDGVVRDATMLGISEFVPLLTDRSEVDSHRLQQSGRIARWRRIAVASAKQCGRAVVPAIADPLGLEQCLQAVSAECRVLLVEPTAGSGHATGVRDLPLLGIGSALLIVGPEGGWTDAETDCAMRAGCRALTLGPRTLRAETAPSVGLTVLQCLSGEFD
jgi:16S rRNA (uracil1498-N3)-methyltransferase